jgi:hypothetical protein
MKPDLIVSEPNGERAMLMRRGVGEFSHIRVLHLNSNDLRGLPELDAIYLTIMAAERWGAHPIVHQAQVLETKPDDRIAGWPAYVVAGVAMKSEDPREPSNELRLIIRSAINAVEGFNAQNKKRLIQTVGFGPEWTGITRLDALHAGQIIRAAYEETGMKTSTNSQRDAGYDE